MLVIDSTIQGDPVKINCPTPDDSSLEISEYVWAWALRSQFLGLDVESQPLDVLDPRNMWGQLRGNWTRLVQFGSMDEAWVLRMDVPWQRALIVRLLSSLALSFTTWSDIDVRAVYADLGIDITSRYFDGLTLALLRLPGQYTSHKLKDTCADYGLPELAAREQRLEARAKELEVRRPSSAIKQRAKEGDEAWALRRAARDQEIAEYDAKYPCKGGWNKWRDIPIDDPIYLEYAGLDAIGARRMFPIQVTSCRDYGIPSDTIKRELHRQQRVARRSITRGMLVDRTFTQLQMSTIGAQHQAAKASFEKLTGLKSGSPFRAKWFEDKGVQFTKRTDSGESWSLAKEDLKDLIVKYAQERWRNTIGPEVHEAMALLREVSSTKNLHDFTATLLKLMDDEGIVRPNVRILGAETGRHTVTGPAVQTLSNGNVVRGCFPALPGHVLASIDLSQIEVRIAAALSGETRLIEAFNRGEDAYNLVAETLFGANFTKRERSIAKRVILATLYGAGVATIVAQLHDLDGITVDPDQVAEVRRQFRRQYRKITDYGYLVNTGDDVWLYSGRYVPGDQDKTYRGINSACQGSGRDILMDVEDRVCEAGFEDSIVLDIHDEILFMLPEPGLRDSLLKLRQAFQAPFKGVKVTCDIEIYPERWGHGMLVPRPEGLCRPVKGADGVTYELVKEWE